MGDVLSVLEHTHPALRGTLREHRLDARWVKPHIRVFAGGEDLMTLGLAGALPVGVRDGREPLRIAGAISWRHVIVFPVRDQVGPEQSADATCSARADRRSCMQVAGE